MLHLTDAKLIQESLNENDVVLMGYNDYLNYCYVCEAGNNLTRIIPNFSLMDIDSKSYDK